MQIKKDHKSIHISMEGALIFIPASLTALILAIICIEFNNSVPIKPDTFLLVLGNLGIAYYISTIINKEHKDNELKVSNCFKELDSLLELVSELRQAITDNKFNDDFASRSMSLISLQISLIKRYLYIEDIHIDKLLSYYKKLNTMLTDSDEIDLNYKHQLLAIEKKVFVIKSEIL